MEIPPRCVECPTAKFLKDAYDEYSLLESAAITAESEALVAGVVEVAEIASSALKKARQTRMIAEAGVNGLQHCPGFDGRCGLEWNRDET